VASERDSTPSSWQHRKLSRRNGEPPQTVSVLPHLTSPPSNEIPFDSNTLFAAEPCEQFSDYEGRAVKTELHDYLRPSNFPGRRGPYVASCAGPVRSPGGSGFRDATRPERHQERVSASPTSNGAREAEPRTESRRRSLPVRDSAAQTMISKAQGATSRLVQPDGRAGAVGTTAERQGSRKAHWRRQRSLTVKRRQRPPSRCEKIAPVRPLGAPLMTNADPKKKKNSSYGPTPLPLT